MPNGMQGRQYTNGYNYRYRIAGVATRGSAQQFIA